MYDGFDVMVIVGGLAFVAVMVIAASCQVGQDQTFARACERDGGQVVELADGVTDVCANEVDVLYEQE